MLLEGNLSAVGVDQMWQIVCFFGNIGARQTTGYPTKI